MLSITALVWVSFVCAATARASSARLRQYSASYASLHGPCSASEKSRWPSEDCKRGASHSNSSKTSAHPGALKLRSVDNSHDQLRLADPASMCVAEHGLRRF